VSDKGDRYGTRREEDECRVQEVLIPENRGKRLLVLIPENRGKRLPQHDLIGRSDTLVTVAVEGGHGRRHEGLQEDIQECLDDEEAAHAKKIVLLIDGVQMAGLVPCPFHGSKAKKPVHGG